MIHVITAYRHGNREGHSYVVGATTDAELAVELAGAAEDYRGKAYECEIVTMKDDRIIGYIQRLSEELRVLNAIPKNGKTYHNPTDPMIPQRVPVEQMTISKGPDFRTIPV